MDEKPGLFLGRVLFLIGWAKLTCMHDQIMRLTAEYIDKIAEVSDIHKIDVTVLCTEICLDTSIPIHHSDGIAWQQLVVPTSKLSNNICLMVVPDLLPSNQLA